MFLILNRQLMNYHLFIRFTVRVFRELLSVSVYNSFPFGFEGGIWDLILLMPEPSLLFYFV